MKTRYVYIILLASFLKIGHANAQYIKDVNGGPLPTKAYTDIEGSPFLFDNWVKGIVSMADGRTFKNVLLKYNQIDDELYFQYRDGEALTFVDPVKEFKLFYVAEDAGIQRYFRNGYAGIPSTTIKSYFEVLCDGTAQLIKRDGKYISESKEYGSSTTTRKFGTDIKYYLVALGKAYPLKRDKKFILTTLGNKQTELEIYIKTSSLNLKNDTDLIKLLTYYNSI